MSDWLTLELHDNSRFILRGDNWESPVVSEFTRLPDGPYWFKYDNSLYLSCLRDSTGLAFDGDYELR